MRPLIFFAFISSVILSACAPSADQIHATAVHIAGTSVALTQTAFPTGTPLPTATLTQTPLPSATLMSETSTIQPTSSATFFSTETPFGQQATDFTSDKDDKDDQNAPLLLQNNSGEVIRFVILSPVHQEYEFSSSMTLIMPEATYTYRAWIGEEGPFNGTFSITNGDKHVLTFSENKIHFATP